jgi:hypothetical protein
MNSSDESENKRVGLAMERQGTCRYLVERRPGLADVRMVGSSGLELLYSP